MLLRRGFTLAESMLAAVVLATAVVGVAGSIAAAHQQNRVLREQGTMLQAARSLLEEVSLLPVATSGANQSNGWSGGETDRSAYDDVFDYNGYSDSSPFKSMHPKGSDMDLGTGYTRRVSVKPYVTLTVPAATTLLGNFAEIRVTVRSPGGRELTLSRWHSRVTIER